MKIKCIIVDDEPLARKVIRSYVEKVPSLELAGECSSAMEAAAALHEQAVDLVFLDIKMPEVTGIEFLKTLETPAKVVITTAYSEYAMEGYEYAVIDYLLKPVSFERFLKAVNKAITTIKNEKEAIGQSKEKRDGGFLFLKSDRGRTRVLLSQILMVEGSKNSVKVHLDEKVIQVPDTLVAMESCLPEDHFLRVHKSFIVAIDKIERIRGNKIFLHQLAIPIGKLYKKDVEQMVADHRP